MLQEVKKGPFAALIIESSQNFCQDECIFRNQCGFIYLIPKIVEWAKFEAKPFCHAKPLGQLFQRSAHRVFHSTEKIEK